MAKKKKPSIVAESNRREVLRKKEAAEKAAQSRNRRIVIAAALAMGVVIVAVFAIVIVQQINRGAGGTTVPPNANADHTGIVVNPNATGPIHTVSIYLDYQCTACKALEDTYGAQLQQSADAGQINLEYRAVSILDSGSNDASLRAAVAAACADTVGYYSAYHDQIFANQPTQEGIGFTAEQLRNTFPQAAGITSDLMPGFQQCYDNRSTQQFVQGVSDAALKLGVTSTPQVAIDGTLSDNYATALTNLLAELQTTVPATPVATPAAPDTPAAPATP